MAKFRLTGDLEIDCAFPERPVLLAEAACDRLGRQGLLLFGGLAPCFVPGRPPETLAFLDHLDGRREASEVVNPGFAGETWRRETLLQLFRHGLLEDAPSDDGVDTGPAAAALASYCGRARDLTRRYRNRQECLDELANARIRICVDRASFADRLREALNRLDARMEILAGDGGPDATFIIATDPMASRFLRKGQANPVPVLLTRCEVDRFLVGPLIVNDAADWHHEAPNSEGAVDGVEEMAAAFVANITAAIIAGTASINLEGKRREYVRVGGSVASRAVFLVGGKPKPPGEHADSRALADWCPDLASELAFPPRRYAGSKAHDLHYLPANIAAASEFSRARGSEPVEALHEGKASTRSLCQLLQYAFGYFPSPTGAVRRVCPSGGNLGSPEAVVAVADRNSGRCAFYRFVAADSSLEYAGGTLLAADVDHWSAPHRAVRLHVIGNHERTTRKYGRFGHKLVHLDAGFALGVAASLGPSLGIRLRVPPARAEDTLFDACADFLEHRRNTYARTWVADLDLAAPAVESDLGDILLRRASHREFGRLELDLSTLATALALSDPANLLHLGAFGGQVLPIVAVRGTTDQGTYVLQNGRLSRLDSDLHRNDQVINQASLAAAPFTLFFLHTFDGVPGEKAACIRAGAWTARFWLECERIDACGCPAGGAVQSEVLARLPGQFRDSRAIFAFSFGGFP